MAAPVNLKQLAQELQNPSDTPLEEFPEAITGAGAFGRFKRCIRNVGLTNAGYKFRDAASEEVAKAWREEHEILYVSNTLDTQR